MKEDGGVGVWGFGVRVEEVEVGSLFLVWIFLLFVFWVFGVVDE